MKKNSVNFRPASGGICWHRDCPSRYGRYAYPSVEQWAPYPKIEAGIKRQVIFLPEKPNEADYRVELLIGRTMEVNCNRHITGVNLETHVLEGWGYDYLVVGELSAPASTRMACPAPTLTQKFIVASLGDAVFRRYNSRLPLVVYTPEDVEVRYRIWKALDTVNLAEVQ